MQGNMLMASVTNGALSRPVAEPCEELKAGEPKSNSYYD